MKRQLVAAAAILLGAGGISGTAQAGDPGLEKGTLSLEGASCQEDAFPEIPGLQIVVELWMRDLTTSATGFQAFLLFDDAVLDYRGDLSSYTDEPFPLHVRATADAQVAVGELELDGSDEFLGGGTDEDSKLASLVFTVVDPAAETTVGFGGNENFDSELSENGTAIPTNLSPTGEIDLVCPPKGTLSLEGESCQDDAFPELPGHQIVVELWMRDLTLSATGYQAFLLFDDEALNYRGDLSAYSDEPFPLHVRAPKDAETSPGELEFDGSDEFNGDGTGADSLLVTIVFDVKDECVITVIGYGGGGNFESELSVDGVPIPTNLSDSGELALDDTPPVLDCPVAVVVPADVVVNGVVSPCEGAIVEFTVTAEDACGEVSLECVPPSGSFFPIGDTLVTCTAVDACKNVSTCEFVVTVTATNLVKVDVFLWGSKAADRCIHFVAEDCGIFADVEIAFESQGMGAKGTASFELPCGAYQFLCAKDEQHTKWNTVGLTTDGRCWIGAEQFVLRPGDTDNDGDVDINDVTWLIATFGDLAQDGGCPWDGTRDADFNNGGAVQSEDYSLLNAEFLTKSVCLCDGGGEPAAVFESRRAVPVQALPLAARAADLDRNGLFDWRDVRAFELARGLPETVSRRMRTLMD